MRGLRLFVRPIDSTDEGAVGEFLALNGASGTAVPACGLLGKLLGGIVAVVSLAIDDDSVRIDDLVVARELRRKWIGRAMLREVEQLTTKMDRRRIVVDDPRGAEEFLRRVGFRYEGARWEKELS